MWKKRHTTWRRKVWRVFMEKTKVSSDAPEDAHGVKKEQSGSLPDDDYAIIMGITSLHASNVIKSRYLEYQSQICEHLISDDCAETKLVGIRRVLLQRHIDHDIGMPSAEFVKMFKGADILMLARSVEDSMSQLKKVTATFDEIASVLRSSESQEKQLALISNIMI